MVANKLDEGRDVRLPVSREALQILEHRIDAVLMKQGDGIFGIFIEIGVEDALVHEIGFVLDIEQDPTQTMKLKRRECVRIILDYLFENLSICPYRICRARFDFSDDGEAVIRRRARVNCAVSSLLKFEIAFLWNRHRRRLHRFVCGRIHECLRPSIAVLNSCTTSQIP